LIPGKTRTADFMAVPAGKEIRRQTADLPKT
jgi:hypothetical protein